MGFVNENLTYRDVFEFDIDLMNCILNKYEDRIKDTFKDLELVEIKQANDWVSFVYKEIDE